MSTTVLRMWVIYERPLDYPDWYVLRAWDIVEGVPVGVPEREAQLASTLAAARELLPPGLYNIGRQEEDEPQIVEVWV
jgi:hypothetical protein